MENRPLKSSKDIAMEKVKSMEEAYERKPLKTSKEIAMEKAERMLAEAESKEQDREKVEEIEKEHNLKLDETKASMQEQINSLKKAGDEKIKLAKEEMAKYFSKEETTSAKTYDKDGNEIPSGFEELAKGKTKTLEEKNAEEMAKYFSKEETTSAKTYDKDGNEIPSGFEELAKKASIKTEKDIEGPATPEEKAKVQKEAPDDFVKGLRKEGGAEKPPSKTKRIWGWIKERLKGVVTLGYYEFRQGERFRSNTKKETKQIEKAMKGMEENLQLHDLTEEEAYAEAARMKELSKIEGKKGDIEISKEDLDRYSEIINQEKIAENDKYIESVIAGSTKRISEGLKKYKNEFGESVLVSEKIASFQEKLRDKLKVMQKAVIEKNPYAKAYAGNMDLMKKNIRESFDPKYWKRYVYGTIEMLLGAITAKYAVGKLTAEVAEKAIVHNIPALPDKIPMDHNVWTTVKEYMSSYFNIHDLSNSEIMKLTQGMCSDNNIGVNIWDMKGSIMDTAMQQGHQLNIGSGFKTAMEAVLKARGL